MSPGREMADLGELCAQLEAQFAERNFAGALALAERVAVAEAQPDVGLRARLACLVQLSRADDALALLDEHGEALGADAVLPRAFCLYQNGQARAALDLIEPELAARGAPAADDGAAAQRRRMGLLHLQAQLHYKLGAYAEAAGAYQRVLAEDPSAADDEEVLTNATAAYVMAGRGADALRLRARAAGRCSLYELAYNYACAQIAQEDYAGARAMLDEALALSTHALHADELADDDEIAAEQAAIRVQTALVAQRSGDEAAAQEGYLGVLRIKGHEAIDTTVAAVAANNLVALRGDRDLFDSAKRCKAALSGAVAAKLLPSQRLVFLANQVVLTWHMGKPALCRELLDQLDAAFPASDLPVLLRVALLSRPKAASKEAPSAEAEALAHRWASAHPQIAARPLLALAQLQARAPLPTPKGQPPVEPLRRACNTLVAIPPLRLAPRLVATVSALLEALGETAAAAAFLDETLDRLGRDALCTTAAIQIDGASDDGGDAADGAADGGRASRQRQHEAILRGAGAFFERHALWRQMAEVQQQLLRANPRDLAARARLVVAASHFDGDLAAQHDALLPDVHRPPARRDDDEEGEGEGEEEEEVDIEQLENLQLPSTGRGYQPAAPVVAAAAAAAATGGKRSLEKGGASAVDPAIGAKRRKCARARAARRRPAPDPRVGTPRPALCSANHLPPSLLSPPLPSRQAAQAALPQGLRPSQSGAAARSGAMAAQEGALHLPPYKGARPPVPPPTPIQTSSK